MMTMMKEREQNSGGHVAMKRTGHHANEDNDYDGVREVSTMCQSLSLSNCGFTRPALQLMTKMCPVSKMRGL